MRYTSLQRKLVKLFSEYGDVKKMYVGALQGYHTKNEDYFAQCGTSIREILDKLSRLNIPHPINEQRNVRGKETVFDHRERKQNEAADRILNFFDPQHTRTISREHDRSELKTIIDYFNDLVHHRGKNAIKQFDDYLRRFENIMYDLLRHKSEIINIIKKMLAVKYPRKNMFVRNKKIIFHNNTTVNYFFNHVDRKWFNILYNDKCMIMLDVSSYNSLIRYLIRMVKYYPKKVANVILDLPHTNKLNYYHLNKIIKLFSNISLQNYDKMFIDKMKNEKWINHLLATDLEIIFDFLKKLIHKKLKKNAYELLNIIIEYVNKNTSIISYTEKKIIDFIKIILDKLLKKYPIRTIKYLLKKVKDSNTISKKNNHVDKFTHTIQYIPNHKLIHDSDLGPLFIVLSCKYILKIKWKISAIKQWIKYLDALNMPIFKRLKILIYEKYHNKFKKQIHNIIINDFDNYVLQYEYNHLLKSTFQKLNERDKKIYFNRIEAGPTLTEIIYYVKTAKNELIDDKFIYLQILNWKKRKLSHIEEFMNNAEKNKLKKIIDHNYTYGLDMYSKSISKERQYDKLELGMSLDHVVAHINNYDNGKEITRDDNSPNIFSNIVKNNIIEYIKNMDKFLNAHDEFIISFFNVITETTEHDKIEWNSIVKFCNKLLNNYKIKNRDDNIIVEILYCFYDALIKNKIKFNDNIWKLILKIYELDKSISNSNDISFDNPVKIFSYVKEEKEAINYVDGVLFSVILEYLIWSIKNNDNKKEEIFKILNTYLKNKSQYTIAKHMVLGEYYNSIILIDKKWAVNSKSTIFEEINNVYTIAAWVRYLENNNNYNKAIYSVLRNQYKKHSQYGIECFRGNMIKHITIDYLLTTNSNSIFDLMVREFIKELKLFNGNEKIDLQIQICTFEIKKLLEYHKYHKEPKLQLENLEEIWKKPYIADSVSLPSWIKFTPFKKEKTLQLCTDLFRTEKYYGKGFHIINEIEKYFLSHPELTAQCLCQFLKYANNITREDHDMIEMLVKKISKNKSLKPIYVNIKDALLNRSDLSGNYSNV